MNNERPNLGGLKEWEDFDLALFGLGRALGVFPKEYQDIPNIKAIHWSKTPINVSLTRIAEELVRVGYLEDDAARLSYRLKDGFNAAGGEDRGQRVPMPLT